MRKSVLAAAITLVAFPYQAMSTEVNRVVSITSILPVSANRPAIPTTQNIVRVYFTAAPFGSTGCRTDAADISVDDWHVYSTVLSGWRNGKTITLYVDDTVHLVSGDVTCGVVAARVE